MGPPFETTIQLGDINCRTRDSAGAVVYETAAEGSSGHTYIELGLLAATNALSVSTSDTETGATSTTMTINWTT